MSPTDHPLIRRFVEEAGNVTQALGVGRVVGQVYAYLYFSAEARSLDDMKEALGISKGSASMSVRQLELWGAVQQVWVKGDRKDYYRANDYFGQILRNLFFDSMGKRMEAFSGLLDSADAELNGGRTRRNGAGGAEEEFLRARVQRLHAFQKKAQALWNNPLVKMLLR